MPLLRDSYSGQQAREQAEEQPPLGPGMPQDILPHIEKLEVWASKFEEPGPDYCEFRAFNAKGERIFTKKVDGY